MKTSIIFTFGALDADRVRAESIEFGVTHNAKVIENGGTPVGILLVRRESTHFYVRLMCLNASAQRSGIGSFVMRTVLAAAEKESLPVRLRVVSSSPAKAFYERLGFRVTEATPQFSYMQHVA